MAFSFDLIPILVILAIIYCIYWYATIPANLPPGPRGLPLLGSALQTWRASRLAHQLHEWTNEYGPLYKFYVADKLILVLGDWNTIQEALVKQGDVFSSRPRLEVLSKDIFEPGSGLVQSDGELWKNQRRFALSTLRDFGFGRPILEPKIKHEAEYLCEEFVAQKNQPFDPATLLNNAVSNVICDLVFGRRFDYDDERFHGLLRHIRKRLTETEISTMSPIVQSKNARKLLKYLPQAKQVTNLGIEVGEFTKEEIVVAMKDFDPLRDEPNNYVQAFYQAKHEGKGDWTFTDNQLITSVFNLFVAGTDTTATTLRWALFYMAHNPEWQEKVYNEILKETSGQSLLNYSDRIKLPLTDATLMETQRMANLAPLSVMHRTEAKCKLLGYDIPEDTVVVPLLTAVLWDPKVYPNPRQFDPSRYLNGNKIGDIKGPEWTHLIPFSVGKRSCLGESLARMELFIFFTAMISRFKFVFPANEPVPDPLGERMAFLRAPPNHKICAIRRTEI